MTKYDEIQAYEEAIAILQAEVNKLKNDPTKKDTVKRGDFIRCTASVEWSYSKGDRMWVDSVHPGHILVRSENPKCRGAGVFWCANSDWEKD